MIFLQDLCRMLSIRTLLPSWHELSISWCLLLHFFSTSSSVIHIIVTLIALEFRSCSGFNNKSASVTVYCNDLRKLSNIPNLRWRKLTSSSWRNTHRWQITYLWIMSILLSILIYVSLHTTRNCKSKDYSDDTLIDVDTWNSISFSYSYRVEYKFLPSSPVSNLFYTFLLFYEFSNVTTFSFDHILFFSHDQHIIHYRSRHDHDMKFVSRTYR